MQVEFTTRFIKSYKASTKQVQNAFDKQLAFLLTDLTYPSLHAKKYDEKLGIWQARVNRDWRFYFTIEADTYYCIDIMAHPK